MERDELLDSIFWLRCLIGLLVGIIAGILKFTGAPVIIVFGLLMFGGNKVYCESFLGVEEGQYNDQELLMEGAGNGVGLFMLSWILMYSYA